MPTSLKLCAPLFLTSVAISFCLFAGEQPERKMTTQEFIAEVSGNPYAETLNLGGDELLTEGNLSNIGDRYSVTPADAPLLLDAMKDATIHLPGRICAAAYLLKLKDEKARTFLRDILNQNRYPHEMEELLAAFRWHLRKDKDKWAIDLLVAALNDNKLATSRNTICHALYETDTPEVRDAIMRLLKNAPRNASAAYYLAALGIKEGIDVLLAIADTEIHSGSEPTHIEFLIRQKRPEVVDFLLKHLDAGYWPVKFLADIGDANVVPAIREYVKRHPEVEQGTYFPIAIARLELKDPTQLATRLCPLLDDKRYEQLQRDILQVLKNTHSKVMISPVVAIMKRTEDTDLMLFCRSALMRVEPADGDLFRALADLLNRDFVEKREPHKGLERKPYRLQDEVIDILKRQSKQDFGNDVQKWQAWVKANYPN